MLGEFAGTFLFLFFAFAGTQVANTKAPDAPIASAPDPASLLYIALCFGFSLAVNAWVFFRISGGLFNPAALPWLRGALLVLSQLLGGIISAAIVSVLFPGPLNVRTSLSPITSIAQGLFIEMFLTAQLVFTIFMLAAEKHKGTFIAPIGIGLSLFIAELTGERKNEMIHVHHFTDLGLGVYYTGGSLNPARSFGPSVVLHSFYNYDWIYWLGPVLGALLASGLYKFIKILEYETANPGQDFDEREQDFFDPSKGTTRPIVNLVPDGSAFVEDANSRPGSGLPDVNSPGPEFEHPPPPELRGGQPPTGSMTGGRAGTADRHDGNMEGGSSGPESRYQRGPDAESGKATPRESGRV
ncbi:MAG: hypothetical protein Q9226_000927 [Calogaya cf. arnoldii]